MQRRWVPAAVETVRGQYTSAHRYSALHPPLRSPTVCMFRKTVLLACTELNVIYLVDSGGSPAWVSGWKPCWISQRWKTPLSSLVLGPEREWREWSGGLGGGGEAGGYSEVSVGLWTQSSVIFVISEQSDRGSHCACLSLSQQERARRRETVSRGCLYVGCVYVFSTCKNNLGGAQSAVQTNPKWITAIKVWFKNEVKQITNRDFTLTENK